MSQPLFSPVPTRVRLHLLSLLVAASLGLSLQLGCDPDDDPGRPDSAAPDAAAPDAAAPDAAAPDAGLGDAAADAGPGDAATPDSGLGDASVPLPGFGALSGDCGELDDAEWTDATAILFRGAIDFGALAFDASALSPGGQQIWIEDNLGGTSLHSEIFAYEVLYRCELAALLKTERFIDYQDAGGKKTDLLVSIDSRKVGVSVTRAYHYPPSNPYTLVEAEALLTDKLADVLLSAANAEPWDAWERSILHVIAYDAQYADAIETAFYGLDPSITAETILMLTVTDGNDAFIY